MQQIFKIEQPTSSLSSLSQSQPSTPKTLSDLMQIITKLLLEGKESAQIIKNFMNERLGLKVEDHDQVDLVHHSLVTLNSLENTLSIIKSYSHEDVTRKRKLDSTNIIGSLDHIKIEDSSYKKERRGCYKRRRDGQTWTKNATDLVDDGYAWRKYGQKEILGTKYPRNYYRCTHKHDQHCQATKQVQQVSENPNKFNIVYHGQHTCKNLQTTSSIIIDPQENSSNLLSFEIIQNYPSLKNSLNSSSFFPSSTFNNNNHAMVKQEYTSIKKELPILQSEPHDLDHDHHSGTHSNNLQSSSCSENLPSSSDLTSSTPKSDQADSYAYEFDDIFMFYMDQNHSLDEIMMNY